MILDGESVALALGWAWHTALQAPPSRAELDRWDDIGERLHGMRLLFCTAADTPERAALLDAVELLDDIACHHYDAIAAQVFGLPVVTVRSRDLPWEAP